MTKEEREEEKEKEKKEIKQPTTTTTADNDSSAPTLPPREPNPDAQQPPAPPANAGAPEHELYGNIEPPTTAVTASSETKPAHMASVPETSLMPPGSDALYQNEPVVAQTELQQGQGTADSQPQASTPALPPREPIPQAPQPSNTTLQADDELYTNADAIKDAKAESTPAHALQSGDGSEMPQAVTEDVYGDPDVEMHDDIKEIVNHVTGQTRVSLPSKAVMGKGRSVGVGICTCDSRPPPPYFTRTHRYLKRSKPPFFFLSEHEHRCPLQLFLCADACWISCSHDPRKHPRKCQGASEIRVRPVFCRVFGQQ